MLTGIGGWGGGAGGEGMKGAFMLLWKQALLLGFDRNDTEVSVEVGSHKVKE